jgi:hypothetical protein
MKEWSSSETPSVRSGESRIKAAARQLRDWLNGVLDEAGNSEADTPLSEEELRSSSGPSVTEAQQGSKGYSEHEEPSLPSFESLFEPAGPPEEWLRLVREGAPELLLPEEEGGTAWRGLRSPAMESEVQEEWSAEAANSVSMPSLPKSEKRRDRPATGPTSTKTSTESIWRKLQRRAADVIVKHQHGSEKPRRGIVERVMERSIHPRRTGPGVLSNNRQGREAEPAPQPTVPEQRSSGSRESHSSDSSASIEGPGVRRPRHPAPATNVVPLRRSSLTHNAPASLPPRKKESDPLAPGDFKSSRSVPGRVSDEPPRARLCEAHLLTEHAPLERPRMREEKFPTLTSDSRRRASASQGTADARQSHPEMTADVNGPKLSPARAPSAPLPLMPARGPEADANDRWPELPETHSGPGADWQQFVRRAEHLRALDIEQRGGR